MDVFFTFVGRFFGCLRHVVPVLLVLSAVVAALAWLFSVVESIGFFDAFYFAVVTALAVGYGDIVPVTAAGKVIGMALGMVGMVLFGIVVGISTRTIMVVMHPDEVRRGGGDE
ncbi:two pore domain potassium channel family protein [Dissulfurirhabdus thermomarina]|uniref:Two pore domain potassium channel family protein n=1 Tax=Dissulfurirhabdus thermomarina TaxID=1765737 RepID=A0A6N9TWZ8_DISTH|nr:potassium channel family protein [Dissulfurirhabdus thermomarina]NDY43006.1 two pore domain potassium channel family protein [Dissulfurirhabdus thermomarina]NMX23827.1 two pore domain potassium channel family protein [Dissulfurirhabdus thermomarina]